DLYTLERDALLEKLIKIRGDQLTRDWIKQARAQAKIVNNIKNESTSADDNTISDNQTSNTPDAASRK
ncbi:hypothetical protein KAR34_13865, partial [bacterium]|nr:hypothetical protein [bacterium]